jgi:hypothetical protein
VSGSDASRWEQGRGDGQTYAATTISFYFFKHAYVHLPLSLPRQDGYIYIIQTRIFGICDVEIDGNSAKLS